MPKTNAFSDAEVGEFLDRLPRHITYNEMASACARQFGAERAWSRTKIVRYWNATHPARKGKTARIDLDPEVRDFVEDRLGRMTLDELVVACRDRFGPERSPSSTGIHCHWKRLRKMG